MGRPVDPAVSSRESDRYRRRRPHRGFRERRPAARVEHGRQGRLAQIASRPRRASITKMNRVLLIDSKLSLDPPGAIYDSAVMISQPYQLYIERSDALKNMARYYAMDISATLFGQACLTRRWGRIGSRGQSKLHVFEDEREAVSLFLDILRQKRGRGYRPAGQRHLA